VTLPRLCAVVAVLSLLIPASSAAAGCPRTSLGDVEDEVMCVVCGTPLGLATEAPQANRERALIQRQVDACRSKDEIKDRLVAEYGDEVLALPKSSGFDLASYLVPALAVILGGGAVTASAIQWRRVRRRGDGPGGGDKAPSAAASDRLQTDLDRYEL
jgi:cytochrome c-type biogenesis protein CcmH